jgi:hypothetical protein
VKILRDSLRSHPEDDGIKELLIAVYLKMKKPEDVEKLI